MRNPKLIALLTSAALPSLYAEESSLLPAFQAAGVEAQPVIWSDAAVDWRRIDRAGRLLLMEAELFEPYLVLAQAPEARDRSVRAIAAALGGA